MKQTVTIVGSLTRIKKRLQRKWYLLFRPLKPSILDVAVRINRTIPITTSERIFSANSNHWRSFYVPKERDWYDTLSSDLRSCLGRYPELSSQYHELLEKQTLPVGFILSTGRSGTRALSMFLSSAPMVSSLHRINDINEFKNRGIEDQYNRSTVIYSLMLRRYDMSWLRDQILYVINLLSCAINYSNKTNTEFWYSAHRWNCYYPLVWTLIPNHKLIYLKRDPYKVIYSMVTQRQYANLSAATEIESTWKNIEPMDVTELKTGMELKLTEAPMFDRIVWYLKFVEYLYRVSVDNFTGVNHCEYEIEGAHDNPSDSYNLLKSTANLSSVTYEDYLQSFSDSKNKKLGYVTDVLKFPEVKYWHESMFSKYDNIVETFNKKSSL